jgi:hypothetical protein
MVNTRSFSFDGAIGGRLLSKAFTGTGRAFQPGVQKIMIYSMFKVGFGLLAITRVVIIR